MGIFDFLRKKKHVNPEVDFSTFMKAKQQARDVLFNNQRPNDPDYGYSLSNPIMTSTVSSANSYLQRLRTKSGQTFTWNRVGSFCMRQVHGVESVMVDKYMLFLDGEEYKAIFICSYGHDSHYAPCDMLLDK